MGSTIEHPAWLLVVIPLLSLYCVTAAAFGAFLFNQSRDRVLGEVSAWKSKDAYAFWGGNTSFVFQAVAGTIGPCVAFWILVLPCIRILRAVEPPLPWWVTALICIEAVVFPLLAIVYCQIIFGKLTKPPQNDRMLNLLGLPATDYPLLQRGWNGYAIARMRRRERQSREAEYRHPDWQRERYSKYQSTLHAKVLKIEDDLLDDWDDYRKGEWSVRRDVAERNRLARLAWAESNLPHPTDDPDWVVVPCGSERVRGLPPAIANDATLAPPPSLHSMHGVATVEDRQRLAEYNNSEWPRIERIEEILDRHYERQKRLTGGTSNLPNNRWRKRLVAERNRLARLEWVRDGAVPDEASFWDDAALCSEESGSPYTNVFPADDTASRID